MPRISAFFSEGSKYERANFQNFYYSSQQKNVTNDIRHVTKEEKEVRERLVVRTYIRA